MRDWMRRIGLVAVLPIASGCVVYSSPRCYFDRGEGLAILQVYMHLESVADGPQVSVAYWKDGFVDTALDGDTLFCRRLEVDAHKQIIEVVESSTIAFDRRVPIGCAFLLEPGGSMVYAQIGSGTKTPSHVWWSAGLETLDGHIERLDEIFCALESELSALRRVVKKRAPDFLAARGRELPCGGKAAPEASAENVD